MAEVERFIRGGAASSRGVRVVRYAGTGKVDVGIVPAGGARAKAAVSLTSAAARELAAALVEVADIVEEDFARHRPDTGSVVL